MQITSTESDRDRGFCGVRSVGHIERQRGTTVAGSAATDSYNSGTAVPPEKPTKPADVAADRALTQKIRKAIANDKTLSASGRRVKVTAQAGKVTLQGSAASEAERTDIFTKAADAAGGANVTNNIKVTSSPQS